MATLTELNLYPIKSCGGLSLDEANIAASGLVYGLLHDRQWMVVDAAGNYLTQRTHPKMACVKPHLAGGVMEVIAPGMRRPMALPLALPDPDVARSLDVKIWNDEVQAYDCGDAAASWFSIALGASCRLVRFHPHAQRSADPAWTDGIEAPALFSDGFPILVISEASLADLNEKLMREGRDSLPMNRFRPNIVIGCVEAFEEDYAASITIGDVVLKPVKPCPRCPVPSVDQENGEIGPDPLDILRTYRVNAKVNGGITFGMNTVVQSGAGMSVRVDQEVDLLLDF
ncbi:MAG: MOSC domain-containing protein [Burkholderiaceae bacterium]